MYCNHVFRFTPSQDFLRSRSWWLILVFLCLCWFTDCFQLCVDLLSVLTAQYILILFYWFCVFTYCFVLFCFGLFWFEFVLKMCCVCCCMCLYLSFCLWSYLCTVFSSFSLLSRFPGRGGVKVPRWSVRRCMWTAWVRWSPLRRLSTLQMSSRFMWITIALCEARETWESEPS